MQASGKVREFVGSVQKTAGDVSEVVGRVTRKARRTVATTDEIVTGHPYAVLAASALFGVVVGILLTATRTRVIYVRPRAQRAPDKAR